MTEAKAPRRKSACTKLTEEHTASEKEKLDRHWRGLFLDTLAETSNVSQAARAAGISPGRAYKARRKEPAFARLWSAALLEGYEHLELETLHRLRMGVGKDDPKFDIANSLRLLVLHRETVARERARHETDDEAAILASINAKIDVMRAREREVAKLLAEETGTAETERPHDAG